MNELQIFKGDFASDFSNVDKMQLFGQMAYMLSLAVRAADKNDDEKLAWEIMDKAWNLYGATESEKFHDLYQAVAIYLTYVRETKSCEFHFQGLFNKYAHLLIKDCKVVKKPVSGKLIPDSWVEIGGEVMPVEVKKETFGKKALDQLERYISYYKTKGGIAVAKEIRVELPENILFISIDELEKADRQEQAATGEVRA